MAPRDTLRIDLGLQGGGAHGAFTWGVLDRLLEEEWIDYDGVSGTSAGAMNAAVLVDGLAAGGHAAARAGLEAFWRRVAEAGRLSPIKRGPIERAAGLWTLDYSPMFALAETAARAVSPYDLNPFGLNPLRDILLQSVDFERLATAPVKLFVNATNVRTGRGRVFRNAEITPQVLLASACLPTIYQAIEIDGDAYWDGGYSGNPALLPLLRECHSRDTIIIQINPIERPDAPRSAREIHNRLNEVAFNAVLMKELRSLAMARVAFAPKNDEAQALYEMRVHRIASDVMLGLGYSSKLLAEWDFFCMLRDDGRATADAFLAAHADDLGKRSTLDLMPFLEGI